jgi:integrase
LPRQTRRATRHTLTPLFEIGRPLSPARLSREKRPSRQYRQLRHTFARIAIEHNRPIFWLSKHLGHSSLEVTSGVYGHFEKATRRREAEAMAGVFGV